MFQLSSWKLSDDPCCLRATRVPLKCGRALRARYLKFKFLSHYGDEFYCTVSQIKVHGSTMLESFQDEWLQSSAEVKEVQDMMKKDPTKTAAASAAATTASGNANPPSGGAGAVGASNASSVPTPGDAPRPGSGTAPASGATKAPSTNDGGVEHRPHAASAATVPEKRGAGAGGVAGGGNSGGGGTGTATVEEIVRGVPAEMVVPASTACVGPTGADGSCLEESIVDGAGSSATASVEDAASSLGAGIPTMGGGTAPGRVDDPVGAGGGEGAGSQTGPTKGNGGTDSYPRPIGEGVTSGTGEARGGGVGPSASEHPESDSHVSSEGAGAGAGEQGQALEEGTACGFADSTDGGGNGAGMEGSGSGAAGGGSRTCEKQAQAGEEEPPQRKGIIHSTMEAISKAVHRGDGSKAKEGGGKQEVVAPSSSDADDVAPSAAGSAEGKGGVGGKDASAGTDGAVGDVATNDEVAAPEIYNVGTHNNGEDVRNTADAGGDEPPPPATASGQSNGNAGWKSDAGASDDRGASGSASGLAAGGNPPSTRDSEGEGMVNATSGTDEGASGGEAPRRSKAPGDSGAGSTSSGSQAGGGNTPVENVAGAGGSSDSDSQAGFGVDPAEVVANDSTVASVELAGGGKGHAAGEASGAQEQVHHSSAKETLMTEGQGGTILPQAAAGVHADTDSAAAGMPPLTAQASSPGFSAEGTNTAELAAACLDRLSFSEFREEVLARTQQAQQSAGGGVAIGGQYESIFKTLMNKIKTLEINQSLFTLYLGRCLLGLFVCVCVICHDTGLSNTRLDSPAPRRVPLPSELELGRLFTPYLVAVQAANTHSAQRAI